MSDADSPTHIQWTPLQRIDFTFMTFFWGAPPLGILCLFWVFRHFVWAIPLYFSIAITIPLALWACMTMHKRILAAQQIGWFKVIYMVDHERIVKIPPRGERQEIKWDELTQVTGEHTPPRGWRERSRWFLRNVLSVAAPNVLRSCNGMEMAISRFPSPPITRVYLVTRIAEAGPAGNKLLPIIDPWRTEWIWNKGADDFRSLLSSLKGPRPKPYRRPYLHEKLPKVWYVASQVPGACLLICVVYLRNILEPDDWQPTLLIISAILLLLAGLITACVTDYMLRRDK